MEGTRPGRCERGQDHGPRSRGAIVRAVLIVAVLLVAVGSSSFTEDDDRLIIAREVILQDRQGRDRVLLSADTGGAAELILRDGGDAQRARLSVQDSGEVSLWLLDPRGQRKWVFAVDGQGAAYAWAVGTDGVRRQILFSCVGVPSAPAPARTEEAAPAGPSDEAVRAAITACVKSRIPIAWSGCLLQCRARDVASVEIVQRGAYNERLGYWAVRARVRGTCVNDLPELVKWREKPFDGTGDFHLRQDDFGEWKADIEGM